MMQSPPLLHPWNSSGSMRQPSGATSSCGASSPTGTWKRSSRVSQRRRRPPQQPSGHPLLRATPPLLTRSSPIVSTRRCGCCTRSCRSSPSSCGRSSPVDRRMSCSRARPPEGVRGGKRNDSAPRAARRALVRRRVATDRRLRHFRRRQRGVRGPRRRNRRAEGVPARVGRADPDRAAAGGTRRQAHQPAVRRAGARRGGRQGAREGAGVARPATGAGGQAQVAGLLLSALAFGCANQGTPPGGPPRTTPAAILRTVPESGTVVPDFRGNAVVQFDEVIDEAPGSPGPSGGAITGLAQKIVLSPVAGDVKVSWHRSAIHVAPEEGWKPNRVYHLEVLPGIADLRRNVTKTGTTIVFSTGGAPT